MVDILMERSTNDNLSILSDIKDDCRSALIDNYVDVGVDVGLIEYGDKIREIAISPNKINVPKNTKFSNSTFKRLPYFDASEFTDTSYMFNWCENLIELPELNTSNVTNMKHMFYACRSLKHIPKMDTSNVTNMCSIFENCSEVLSIPELDCSKVANFNYACNSMGSLVDIGGFVKLGESLVTDTYLYIVGENVTRESIINVLKNLSAVKNIFAYIIINDLSILTDSEIKIVTNKGWTLHDLSSWNYSWDPRYNYG